MQSTFQLVSCGGRPAYYQAPSRFAFGREESESEKQLDMFKGVFDFRRHNGRVCVLVHKYQESAGVKDGLQVLFDVYTLGKQSGNEVMYRARETLYVPVDTMCVEKGFPDYRVVAEENGQRNLIVGEVLAAQIRAEAKAFEQQYPAPAAPAPRP